MLRLVEADGAAAGQRNGRHHSPVRRLDFGAFYVLRFQRGDGGSKVVAHQVQNRAQQFVPGMAIGELAVERMDAGLRRRHCKDEPPVADINRAEAEHVAEEGAVSFGILAEKKEVRPGNHAAEYIRNNAARFDLFVRPS